MSYLADGSGFGIAATYGFGDSFGSRFGDGYEHGRGSGDGGGSVNRPCPSKAPETDTAEFLACPDISSLAASIINSLVRPT